MGIRDCRHKGLKELYCSGHTARIGVRHIKNALLILNFLSDLDDITNCQGVKDFHALKGDRKGTYSMHVNGNYCITFKWNGSDVYDVDFEDYH